MDVGKRKSPENQEASLVGAADVLIHFRFYLRKSPKHFVGREKQPGQPLCPLALVAPALCAAGPAISWAGRPVVWLGELILTQAPLLLADGGFCPTVLEETPTPGR